MMNSSVFDRLSITETQASASKKPVYQSDEPSSNMREDKFLRHSNQKLKNRGSITTDDFFNRLAASDTYASKTMKGQSYPDERHNSPRNSPPTKYTTNDGFFSHMANTDTYASASKKGFIETPSERPPSRRGKTTTNDFFNRLSVTETYSTATLKGKLTPQSSYEGTDDNYFDRPSHQKQTTSASFFDRMAKSDTFATATLKGKIQASPKADISTSMRGSLTSPKRTTDQGFFNRLSVTETFSTATLKGKHDPISPNSFSFKSPSPQNRQVNTDLFDRLSRTETAAMSIKKQQSISLRNSLQTKSSSIQRPESVSHLSVFDRLSRTETTATISNRYLSPSERRLRQLDLQKKERERLASSQSIASPSNNNFNRNLVNRLSRSSTVASRSHQYNSSRNNNNMSQKSMIQERKSKSLSPVKTSRNDAFLRLSQRSTAATVSQRYVSSSMRRKQQQQEQQQLKDQFNSRIQQRRPSTTMSSRELQGTFNRLSQTKPSTTKSPKVQNSPLRPSKTISSRALQGTFDRLSKHETKSSRMNNSPLRTSRVSPVTTSRNPTLSQRTSSTPRVPVRPRTTPAKSTVNSKEKGPKPRMDVMTSPSPPSSFKSYRFSSISPQSRPKTTPTQKAQVPLHSPTAQRASNTTNSRVVNATKITPVINVEEKKTEAPKPAVNLNFLEDDDDFSFGDDEETDDEKKPVANGRDIALQSTLSDLLNSSGPSLNDDEEHDEMISKQSTKEENALVPMVNSQDLMRISDEKSKIGEQEDDANLRDSITDSSSVDGVSYRHGQEEEEDDDDDSRLKLNDLLSVDNTVELENLSFVDEEVQVKGDSIRSNDNTNDSKTNNGDDEMVNESGITPVSPSKEDVQVLELNESDSDEKDDVQNLLAAASCHEETEGNNDDDKSSNDLIDFNYLGSTTTKSDAETPVIANHNDTGIIPKDSLQDLLSDDTEFIPNDSLRDLLSDDTDIIPKDSLRDLLSDDTDIVPKDSLQDLLSDEEAGAKQDLYSFVQNNGSNSKINDDDDDFSLDEEEEEDDEEEVNNNYPASTNVNSDADDKSESSNYEPKLDQLSPVDEGVENGLSLEDDKNEEEESNVEAIVPVATVPLVMDGNTRKPKYTIFVSDRYSRTQPQPFSENDLISLDLVDVLIAFEDEELTTEDIACEMIDALFDRDFKGGDNWDIDEGTARELDDDEYDGEAKEGFAFAVKRQARFDHDDEYKVAASKGIVTIWPDKHEIRVENYTFFAA